MKDHQLPDDLGDFGDHLHRGRASADDADALAVELNIIIPARGVEGLAGKSLHPFDAGQLRGREDAIGQHDIARAHCVAAVGADRPPAGCLIPVGPFDGGVKQAMVVESELCCHALAIFQDFESRGEFHRWKRAHLLQQRQIAVGFHIAGDAGIAVPVPGAADVAAFLAKPHVLETGLTQLVPQQQAGEACADHQNLARIGQGFPFNGGRRIDIRQIPAEFAFHGDIICCTPPGFLEGFVFCLFLGIEHCTGGRRRKRLQRFVLDRRIALAGNLLGCFGRSRIEELEARRLVDADWWVHDRLSFNKVRARK